MKMRKLIALVVMVIVGAMGIKSGMNMLVTLPNNKVVVDEFEHFFDLDDYVSLDGANWILEFSSLNDYKVWDATHKVLLTTSSEKMSLAAQSEGVDQVYIVSLELTEPTNLLIMNRSSDVWLKGESLDHEKLIYSTKIVDKSRKQKFENRMFVLGGLLGFAIWLLFLGKFKSKR